MNLREQAQDAADLLRSVDRAAERAAAKTDPQAAGEFIAARLREPAPGGLDVNESPNAPAGNAPVHLAWQQVMGDVWWLGKERKARDYMYRGIDDVMDLVGPALRKHGVAVVPIGCSPTYEIINTSKGSPMNYCRTVARFRVYGPQGDWFDAETPGEAFDNGDKAGTKAQSVALRTFYIQALALMTNRPQMDPEYGEQHEIGGSRRPTADEYAAEIVATATSLDRLRTIQAELKSDRRMGETEVEVLGREGRISLLALVGEIGRGRAARGEERG